MLRILRRLHFVSSKSVQCNWIYHGRQFGKRGFEINALEIFCLYVLTKDIVRQKRLYLLQYFEFSNMKWKENSGFLCDRRIPFKLKGKFYTTVIRPALTYGTQCWTMYESYKNKMTAFETKLSYFVTTQLKYFVTTYST